MKIRIHIATLKEKPILANFMQLYLHDMSEFEENVPDKHGLFPKDQYFGIYWTDPDRFPYLLYLDGQPIGFALIRKISIKTYSVAEFFILRPHRGKGLGTIAASLLFSMHPGSWEVAQLERNVPAQSFWHSVIKTYTNNQFIEEWSTESPAGPKQIFDSTNKWKD